MAPILFLNKTSKKSPLFTDQCVWINWKSFSPSSRAKFFIDWVDIGGSAGSRRYVIIVSRPAFLTLVILPTLAKGAPLPSSYVIIRAGYCVISARENSPLGRNRSTSCGYVCALVMERPKSSDPELSCQPCSSFHPA